MTFLLQFPSVWNYIYCESGIFYTHSMLLGDGAMLWPWQLQCRPQIYKWCMWRHKLLPRLPKLTVWWGWYVRSVMSSNCITWQKLEDLLLGSECCFDVAGGLTNGAEQWGKTCCDNRDCLSRNLNNISVSRSSMRCACHTVKLILITTYHHL